MHGRDGTRRVRVRNWGRSQRGYEATRATVGWLIFLGQIPSSSRRRKVGVGSGAANTLESWLSLSSLYWYLKTECCLTLCWFKPGALLAKVGIFMEKWRKFEKGKLVKFSLIDFSGSNGVELCFTARQFIEFIDLWYLNKSVAWLCVVGSNFGSEAFYSYKLKHLQKCQTKLDSQKLVWNL